MKTFAINTLGCKINQYEIQQIRELLERFGLDQVKSDSRPDLVVIHTCCVTHTASAKSRQHISKAKKLSPDAVVVVSGCLPIVQTDEINPDNTEKNIHLIKHRQNIATTLSQIVNGQNVDSNHKNLHNNVIRAENEIESKGNFPKQPKLPKLTDNMVTGKAGLEGLKAFKGQTRAFLKVQDGCDGLCSYCIVPKARPKVSSKTETDILQEAQSLVQAGHKEIVVTGIFLGAYGQETVRRRKWENNKNERLAELLEKLAKTDGLERIRLSSLEPADVTERLLDVFCLNRNIMPHLHLSLQSGSDRILKKMCRQYSADEFLATIEMIKRRLDRPAITTDFIVGFPGETDGDFEKTVQIAREIGFAKMHVFSFSARKGTAAAKMQDTVNNEVIKQRSKFLRSLDIELAAEFRANFIGEKAMVLIENVGGVDGQEEGDASGRSERYFVTHINKIPKNLRKGAIIEVKLVKNRQDGVVGEA